MRIAYPLRLSSCTGSKIYRVPWLYNRIISSLKMLRSRLFQSLRASKLGANTKAVVSRNFGAAGHDHAHSHHAPAGPYDVPHHPSQPNEAYLFGINPNEKYQSQGFEFITISTYLICFGILFFGAMTKDHNSFKNWAKEEALARREVTLNGGEIEFGKWYNKVEYEEQEEHAQPTPKARD